MQGSTLAKRGWLLLAGAAALAYFYGLGRAPFVGADEPRYAEVAREMFARGDWVTPTLGGHHWFEKPALLYWAAIAGFKLFGVSEWAARLGPALSGWLTVLLVGWIAGRAAERDGSPSGADLTRRDDSADRNGDGRDRLRARAGQTPDRRDDDGAWALRLACGAAAASSAGLVVFSRAVNFDILITATVTFALACFAASEFEGDARRRRLPLAGFYAGVGLSLLAKGLIGIVIPFGVVGLYFLLRRRWPRGLRSLLWGLPLAALVASVWYAPVVLRHGREFVEEFFVQHHFARYVSNRYHHPQPFYFYLLIMPLLVLPWTAFFGAALAGLRRWRWRGVADESRDTGESRDSYGSHGEHESRGMDELRDVDESRDMDEPRGMDGPRGADEGRGRVELDGEGAWDRLRVLAAAWIVVPVVFFSLSGSKLPGYVLPALPGAALVVGERVWRWSRGEGGEWPMRATGVLLLVAAAGALAFVARDGAVSVGCGALVAAPLVVGGAAALVTRVGRARRVAAVAGASLLTAMLAAGCALEPASRRESVRELLRLADARGYADWPVVNLHGRERSSEFYAAGRVVYDERGEPVMFEGVNEIEEYARTREGRALVIVPVEHASQVERYATTRAEFVGDNGVLALYAVGTMNAER